jgi:CRISPR-associated protein Csx17
MTISEQVLHGCAPIPLAGYLKALGIFRLVAEQIDPGAKGFWRDERFVLRTRLSQDELVGFFVDTYEPSPIISPWNGRAGFLEGEDEESGEESTRGGAELVRKYEGAGQRFSKLREAVAAYRAISAIRNLDRARAEAKPLQRKKTKKISLTEDEKRKLKTLEGDIKRIRATVVGSLRSEAPDWAIDWFDACRRIGSDNTPMPLLGNGGVDGSRDFGMNFGEALGTLFDFTTGKASEDAPNSVHASLYGVSTPGFRAGNLGQYEPGAVGENTSSAFTGELPFNPFDQILLLEGAMLFSGAATRRLGSETTIGLSFPFTVQALTAGSGAAAAPDDQGFYEFWAPIWHRAAGLEELEALLTEGRAAVDGKTVRNGLEFAVAARRLGSHRGIAEFQRYALLQREPRNPRKATPLGRVRVHENSRASLVSELDSGAWLSRARVAVRDKNAPASLVALGRRLDEALFQVASDSSHDALQEALIAVGSLALETGRRPTLRENLPPPPRLSSGWVEAADDGSHEFALAAALASLNAGAEDNAFRLPFRRHLGPIGWPNGREGWDDTTESQALAVWAGRDLVRDMGAVLERRLIEAQRHKFTSDNRCELPLRGRRSAPLAAIASFLAERTDDNRIAALTAGLAWALFNVGSPSSGERQDVLIFAYAALKPLFNPKGVGSDDQPERFLYPLPLVRLLRAGRTRNAVTIAQRMARAAGLPVPFGSLDPASAVPARFAAALLFPIAPKAYDRLIGRAYPSLTRDEEETDAA